MVSKQSDRMLAIARILGWVAILLSGIILLFFAAIRLADMTQVARPLVQEIQGTLGETHAFAVRYIQHPWVALLHIIPGLLFLTLAPLQFVARIRKRHISLHRGLGRILATCAAITGLFALVAAFRFPAFGGIGTQVATVFFGAIFLFSLAKAIYHIRRREVRLHREWMIRTFALAMGVATIRVSVGLFLNLSGLGFEEVFGTSFWLGFSVNLLVAEVWINHTRVRVGRDPRTTSRTKQTSRVTAKRLDG